LIAPTLKQRFFEGAWVPVCPQDFSTLEEAGTVLDAKCCSGSPVMAASWSPIQVLISPQSQVKDVASPREVSTMMTGAKMKESLV